MVQLLKGGVFLATRPWIEPIEVKDYTAISDVRNRSEGKIKIDISRAEQYILTYTKNKFENFEKVPEAVVTATIILAETYAYNAVLSAKEKLSETFDDYSYTSNGSAISIDSLDLGVLLDEFVCTVSSNPVDLKMRVI